MMQNLLLSMAPTALMLGGQVAAAAEARPFLAEVVTFASGACPANWAPLDGRILQINRNGDALFSLLGTAFGGDGKRTFALPKASPVPSPEGTNLLQCIALTGVYPRDASPGGETHVLSGEVDTFAFDFCPSGWEPLNSDAAPIQCVAKTSPRRPAIFLGEIITFAFGPPWCPEGFAPPAGRILPIDRNNALFVLLKDTYGGNGQTTFALPNFEPIATENGPALQQCIALSGAFPQKGRR